MAIKKISPQEKQQIRNTYEYKYARQVIDKLIKDNNSSWKKCEVKGNIVDLDKESKYGIADKVESVLADDLDVEGYKFTVWNGLQPNGYGYSFFTLEW